MLTATVSILSLSAAISLVITVSTLFIDYTLIFEWNIIPLITTNIRAPIIIDQASTLFITTVLTIAARVIQFTKSYIKEEKFLNRFILLLILFIISIIILILFPNIITLLLGWDGLGITSFVLVIYFQNPKSLGAGLITALTNRIGDVIILLSITLTLNQGHWFILRIFNTTRTNITIIFILLAGITKRAQIPFSRWLPAAMAAPTPVRALVHSSTLVTAGVFLLYRFHPFLSSYKLFNNTLIIVATITILIAGARALAECDIKKIIALSTLSQLGVIIFTLRINIPHLALFHLLTHALFKALLFICAGTIIHYHHHSQDLRAIGNITSQIPLISASITIANMALCGMPFIAGFYSKDIIIESFIISTNNALIYFMFIIATILTTAYSTRFTIYVILNIPRRPSIQYSTETQKEINACIILGAGAIIGGAAINWSLLSPVIDPILSHRAKILPLLIIATGTITGYLSCEIKQHAPRIALSSHAIIWFLTPLSTHSILPMPLKNTFWQLKITDHGWNETPKLLNLTSIHSFHILSRIQPSSTLTHTLRIIALTFFILRTICLNSLI